MRTLTRSGLSINILFFAPLQKIKFFITDFFGISRFLQISSQLAADLVTSAGEIRNPKWKTLFFVQFPCNKLQP